MKKIMALVMAAVMLLACCSFAAAEDIPEEYPEIIEGLDFGGQTVHIYDWYNNGTRAEEPTDAQQAQYDYWDWLQETYHVVFDENSLSDWAGMVSALKSAGLPIYSALSYQPLKTCGTTPKVCSV